MGAEDNLAKRKQTRYAVSDNCRVRSAIKIQSSDEASANKDWPGTLVDVSATGAHIQISMSAVAYKGDSCVLKLSYGAVKAELRCTLAHYICSARYSVCGVKFDHSSPEGYQPFLKAIMASATLKLEGKDTEGGRYREDYRGPGVTQLVVWRDNKPERAVVGFEYTMGRFTAVLLTAGTDMLKNKSEVRFRTAPTERGGTGASLSDSQTAEARWELAIAASNLTPVIPPDIRSFLKMVS
jgi:hypothetical protein